MSLATGNVIKHSVQYLNHNADSMYIFIKDLEKSTNCPVKVTESIKISKLSYFIVYLE